MHSNLGMGRLGALVVAQGEGLIAVTQCKGPYPDVPEQTQNQFPCDLGFRNPVQGR